MPAIHLSLMLERGITMSRIITKTVYTYEELSNVAKIRARGWYSEGGIDCEFLWEHILDDAKTIGLEISALDQHKANEGSFTDSAPQCAETIIREHGPDCKTTKTAKAYLAELTALGDRPSDSNEDASDSDYDDAREELDNAFLQSLLSDYFHMWQKDVEYQESEECVAESIIANEYTFDENGRREG